MEQDSDGINLIHDHNVHKEYNVKNNTQIQREDAEILDISLIKRVQVSISQTVSRVRNSLLRN